MMIKKLTKKIIFSVLFSLILSLFLIIPEECFAKSTITIGKEYSDKSLDTGWKYYKLTLKRKMKVKITVTVDPIEKQKTKEQNDNYNLDEEDKDEEDDVYYIDDEEDDDYLDEEDEDSNTIDFSMEGELYESIIDEWVINEGETKTKTIVLDEGTYEISIYNNTEGLKYSFDTEDKTTYTKKISMVNKLNLIARNRKKITVKSAEKGKSVGEVIWSTSNKKVAIVDSSGKVKGIKQGTCVISAKTKKSNIVKCTVNVKPRPRLYIMEASFDINSVGGVEPYITLQNNFGKTIKYIYFNCYFYNTVNDPAYCMIKNTNYQILSITGPMKNGVIDAYNWDPVIYNNATGKMYIKSAKIIFMDGTSKTIIIKKGYK